MHYIFKALKFAEQKHDGQTRRGSGAPYITHPITVSYLAAKYKPSKHLEELVCASILHDTLEDTNATFLEIAQEFPPLVASLVLELTSNEEEIKKVGKNEYLKKKLTGISNYGLVLKLCDRLHNVMDNPTYSYICDTQELMKHLRKHRKLTKSQKELVDQIMITTTFWLDDYVDNGVKDCKELVGMIKENHSG